MDKTNATNAASDESTSQIDEKDIDEIKKLEVWENKAKNNSENF